MRYRVFWPCAGSASFCAPQVLAQGRIQPDSARRLQVFLQAARQKPGNSRAELPPLPVIAFNSSGGSLPGAIALGRFIRRQGLGTRVAGEYEQLAPGSLTQSEPLARDVRCVDACVLAFAGGVARTVGGGARLGWAQGALGGEPVAAYATEMGVRLPRHPPAAPWLTPQQASALRLDDSLPVSQPWQQKTWRGQAALTTSTALPGGRTVVVTLAPLDGGKVAVAVRLEVAQHAGNAARLPLHPVGVPAQIVLNADGAWLRAQPAQPWRRVREGGRTVFTAAGTLAAPQARQLAQARTLRVSDELGGALADLSLAAPLAVEGLKPGLVGRPR